MKRMFHEQVVPRIPATGVFIRRALIHCYGCGESQADELLGDLTARGRDPEIGITAHEATITLRIEAHGDSEAVCARKIEEASRLIRDRLGRFVFGDADDELQDVVLRELGRRGESFCIVDCGSAGWLERTIAASRSRGDRAYRGGLTVSGLAEGARWLGIEPGCGGPPISVEAVASAARRQLQTTYALAIGELPDVTTDELARGAWRAEVLLCGPGAIQTSSMALGGNPAILSARLGKTALDLLRLEITSPGKTA
jgi:nicotinamide-nucleotide amidase